MLGFRGHFLTKSRALLGHLRRAEQRTPALATTQRPRPTRHRYRQPRPRRRPVDLDTITVINDWHVVHLGHRDHAERELALAIAERNRTQRRTTRTSRGGRQREQAAERLTVAEVCAELRIARSTFYEWRAKGRAPRCIKLPNGDLRIRRAELERWLDAHEDAA